MNKGTRSRGNRQSGVCMITGMSSGVCWGLHEAGGGKGEK